MLAFGMAVATAEKDVDLPIRPALSTRNHTMLGGLEDVVPTHLAGVWSNAPKVSLAV